MEPLNSLSTESIHQFTNAYANANANAPKEAHLYCSIASMNLFSNHVVRSVLLSVSISVDLASAFALTCRAIHVAIENAIA